MPLDSEAAELLSVLKRMGLPMMHGVPLDESRRMMEELSLLTRPRPVGFVGDRMIPGPAGDIPVRIYKPDDGAALVPIVVFFHGGGFVMGSLNCYDALCRDFCMDAHAVVVSVAYRLAPEHKFPAAPDDCLSATRWVEAHAPAIGGDGNRIVVAGDSAGGNLAAVTALRAGDEGAPRLSGQLLIYPTTDNRRYELPSHHEFADCADSFISLGDVKWSQDNYLKEESDASNPLASPLRAPSLRGLPPALVITAECDPLRDEGERYAARLREAGVSALLTRYSGVFHGFLQMSVLGQAGHAMEEICGWLRDILRESAGLRATGKVARPE
jgi:acetyl esterase